MRTIIFALCPFRRPHNREDEGLVEEGVRPVQSHREQLHQGRRQKATPPLSRICIPGILFFTLIFARKWERRYCSFDGSGGATVASNEPAASPSSTTTSSSRRITRRRSPRVSLRRAPSFLRSVGALSTFHFSKNTNVCNRATKSGPDSFLAVQHGASSLRPLFVARVQHVAQ